MTIDRNDNSIPVTTMNPQLTSNHPTTPTLSINNIPGDNQELKLLKQDLENFQNLNSLSNATNNQDANTSNLDDLNNYINCFALRTTTKELNSFFEHILVSGEGHSDNSIEHRLPAEYKELFNSIQPIFSESGSINQLFRFTKLPPYSAAAIFPRMDSPQYWNFRSFEIQSMQLSENNINDDPNKGMIAEVFLNRLRLSLKGDAPDKKNSLQQIHNILNNDKLTPEQIQELSTLLEVNTFNLLEDTEDTEDTEDYKQKVIAYLHEKYKLYKDVTIEIQDNNTAIIKGQDGKPLVTVTYPTYSDSAASNEPSSQHYEFKIADNLQVEDLEKAMKLVVDQAHKSKELTNSNGLTVYGFENNPKQALKLFMLAMNSGLQKIDIDDKTLKAWQEKSSPMGNDGNIYSQALIIADKLKTLSCNCNNPKETADLLQTYWKQMQMMSDQTTHAQASKDNITTSPQIKLNPHQAAKP